MIRSQRRAHLVAWCVIGVVLAAGVGAGLLLRPRQVATPATGGSAPGMEPGK